MRAAISFLLILAVLAGCGSSSHPRGSPAAKRLVDAWKGTSVPISDPSVLVVQRHLASLTRRCVEPEATIAAHIDVARRILDRDGVRESPVSLAAALDTLAYSKTAASGCSSLLGSLIVLLETEKRG